MNNNTLAHAGRAGMKWGYNNGRKNGNREANGENLGNGSQSEYQRAQKRKESIQAMRREQSEKNQRTYNANRTASERESNRLNDIERSKLDARYVYNATVNKQNARKNLNKAIQKQTDRYILDSRNQHSAAVRAKTGSNGEGVSGSSRKAQTDYYTSHYNTTKKTAPRATGNVSSAATNAKRMGSTAVSNYNQQVRDLRTSNAKSKASGNVNSINAKTSNKDPQRELRSKAKAINNVNSGSINDAAERKKKADYYKKHYGR